MGILRKGVAYMKKILLTSLALAALAAPAAAADLAVRPAPVPYKAPPPIVFYNWPGCYIGGNGGGAWVDKDFALNSVGTPFGGVTFATPINAGSHTASSGIGGIQAGCNYQVPGSGWVFGIQGDYDWMSAKASHIDPLGLTTLESKSKWLASVTGRIGYAWDRFLGYVKGGGAWEGDEYRWLVAVAPFGGTVLSSPSETRGGWTVGVGGEYAFTDWITGFVEYDYYGFGTRTVGFPTAVPVTFNVDIKENKSVVKAGINFKFGPGPVVARY